jgi:phytoene synthase
MSAQTNAQQYCQLKAYDLGSIDYYRLRFSMSLAKNADLKNAVMVLMAYCREINSINRQCHDKEIAKKKFDWWQEELERLHQKIPQHPVTQSLLPIVNQYQIPIEYLRQYLQAYQQLLAPMNFLTYEELTHHCHETAGLREILLVMPQSQFTPTEAIFCRAIGVSLELARIIQELYVDLQQDLLLLPEDLLQQYQVPVKQLYEGKSSLMLTQLLTDLQTKAQQQFEYALSVVPGKPPSHLHSSIIATKLYLAQLSETQKDGFKVLSRQIIIPPLRLCWKAWRISQQIGAKP